MSRKTLVAKMDCLKTVLSGQSMLLLFNVYQRTVSACGAVLGLHDDKHANGGEDQWNNTGSL